LFFDHFVILNLSCATTGHKLNPKKNNIPIDVMIKRKVKPGRQAKELVPLILHLRALATYQPGYISGTTLSHLEHPDECLVVSR
jgi:antibiotic biosynthesis monooxygenase (ABM) superfamily enzyme